MNSASHGSIFLLLLLLLISTFQLTRAQINGNLTSPNSEVEAEVEKVSGKDNVEGGELSIAMLTKLRLLFGLHISSSGSKQWSFDQLSPAQAPEAVAAAESPFSLPPLHKLHFYHRAPPPENRKNPNHVSVSAKSSRKKRKQVIVAISVSAVVAMLALFGIMAMLLIAYRQHQKSRICNSSNKVSFDPEPGMLYLESLAQFLERDSDHKLSFESKRAESVESNVTSSLQSEGIVNIHSNSNTENHSEEASSHVECSSSDGNESFHSVCCSHYSTESMSAGFEQSIDCPPETGDLAPLNCSKFAEFSTRSSEKALRSTNFITCSLSKTLPFILQQRLESKTLPFILQQRLESSKHKNEDNIETLPSSQSPVLEMTPETETSSRIAKTVSGIRTNQESSMPTSVQVMNSKQVELLQRVSNGSIPNPPPPPSLPPFRKCENFGKLSSATTFRLQKSQAADEAGSTLPKLKPLHWDKVRASPDRSMVWDKIRSSSFILDEKTIESLFGYNMHCSARNEEPKCKNSSPVKQVLEHKRLQNFTILLKPLNATADQVCSALLLGSGLSIQQLEALAKMAPTVEEEEKLFKYNDEMNELDSTENFLKVILSIPFAFSRLEVMLYRETFEDEVIHLKKSFSILEEACKELRSSRLFMRLLEAVLKTGNRMNVGTIRGGARAFKLDALLKLADVKGADGKTTLLHFVVQEMIKFEGLNTEQKNNEKTLKKSKEENTKDLEEDSNARELELVPALSSELGNVKKTASMDLDALKSSVSNLSKGMNRLTILVEENLSSNERDASFVSSMRSFKKRGDQVIRELEDSESRVFRLVREITEYYHGHGSKDEVNPLRIFIIVSNFLGMLDRVCKELKSSKCQQTLNPAVSLTRGS